MAPKEEGSSSRVEKENFDSESDGKTLRQESRKGILEFSPTQFSSWKSPYGMQIGSIFRQLFFRDKIRIGILGDFSSAVGSACRDIIDAFELTVQKAIKEDLTSSNIEYFEYDLLKSMSEDDQISNDELFKTDRSFLRRIDHYLASAVSSELHVLLVCVNWPSTFQANAFNEILISLRAKFLQLRDGGCISVIAAGNGGVNLDEVIDSGSETLRAPLISLAREDAFRNSMLVVGTSGVFGQYCSFSNYGPNSVDFAAPGEYVLLNNGKEVTDSSASAAFVTALIAVMLLRFPRLAATPSLIIPRLIDSLDPLFDISIPKCRFQGRINPSRVLHMDLVGSFGFLAESMFSDDVTESVKDIQQSIRLTEGSNAPNFDSFFEPNSVASFGIALDQLSKLQLESDQAQGWKIFELNRILNLIAEKESIGPTAGSLSNIEVMLRDAEKERNRFFSFNEIDSNSAVSLYTKVLSAINDCIPTSESSAYVRFILQYYEYWIDLRISEILTHRKEIGNDLRQYVAPPEEQPEEIATPFEGYLREDVTMKLESTAIPFSIWNSPYGVPMDFVAFRPFSNKEIRVGILGDFSSAGSNGYECQELIKAFEFSAQKAAGEDTSKSFINFFQYDYMGTIMRKESTNELSRFDNLFDEPKLITGIIERFSILLEYLKSASQNRLNVLLISVSWMASFPKEVFQYMQTELQKIFSAFRDSGCICIIPAGNESLNLDTLITNEMIRDDDGQCWIKQSLFVSIAEEEENRRSMIVVSASNSFGLLSSWSNYGSSSNHIAAPAEGAFLSSETEVMHSGTSAAASIVASLVAVMLQVFPRLSGNVSEIIPRIMKTADPLPFTGRSVIGRVNASRALRMDFTGVFSVFDEGMLPIELLDELRDAERLERDVIRLRDLSILGEMSLWGNMCAKLSDEIKSYESLYDELNRVLFEDETMREWLALESERLSKYLVSQRAALTDWKQLEICNFTTQLWQAEAIFSPNDLLNEQKSDLHTLYTMALEEVEKASEILQFGTSVHSFLANLKYWIKRRIENFGLYTSSMITSSEAALFVSDPNEKTELPVPDNVNLVGETPNFDIDRYRLFRKIGFRENLIREMMVSDGCSEAVLNEFFADIEKPIVKDNPLDGDPSGVELPPLPFLKNYSVRDSKESPWSATYILEHVMTRKIIRIERNRDSLLGMVPNCVLFTSTEAPSLSLLRHKMVETLKDRILDFSLSIELLSSAMSLNKITMAPPDSIVLFDCCMLVLSELNLRPFPDYIMHTLSYAARERNDAAELSDLVSTPNSVWTSLYGIPLEPIFQYEQSMEGIRVGILDDFRPNAYHGRCVRRIIDAFELNVQQLTRENSNISSIYFYEHNFLGDMAEQNAVDEPFLRLIQNEATALHKHIDQIHEFHEVRVSKLIEYLILIAAQNLHVLNISLDWRNSFPQEYFNNMLEQVRSHFRVIKNSGCICVVAAGNDFKNLDLISTEIIDGVSFLTQSFFAAIANETELKDTMVVVGASGVYGQYCSFSNYGSGSVHFAAPGKSILLGERSEIDGTSFAAPFVSALIAVMLQVFPHLRHNISAVIPRIVDTLDPLSFSDLDENSSNSSGKCRNFGRINPSRALRKDLIGPFGIFAENDLSQELVGAVNKVQDQLRKADKLEIKIIGLRDLSLMGSGPYWNLMNSKLNDEIEIYRSLLDQLDKIEFENGTALAWKIFELERINNLIGTKMGVLFGWQWITSHNHDYRFPESLGRAETLFSTNGWMDSLSNKIVLHNFYGTAREEVNRIWNELNNNGFPEHFWSYLKHTIERSVREINSSLLLSSWRNCYKSMDICGDCRRKKK